ncbi:hypothetical protein NP493_721g03033 [Ridgeia piscesae]|uniref:Uncharacterized protein n=1 Tax=Ridgeia piscesae TaxID=27915 RepID=A0AAD9KQA0_RIDPI|nr:hypothetical protein NP493_721g03033 [Ridgeia piscesae]
MYEEKRYLGAELAVDPAAEWITLSGDCPPSDPDPARHKSQTGVVRCVGLSRTDVDPAQQRCPGNKTFIYERAAMA